MSRAERVRVGAQELRLRHSKTVGPVYFHGETMRPLLGEGDHVIVEPIAWEDIRRGDIVTYRFHDKFPTRRVIRIDRGTGTLKIRGDSIPDWPDYLVRREDVLGRAEMRIRDGARIDRRDREWRRARRTALTMHVFVALARRAPSPFRGMFFQIARMLQRR